MFFANPKCSQWTLKLLPGFGSDLQAIPENQFPELR
jgi:hypothetical protein